MSRERSHEQTIYGIKTCLAVFQRRREDILRIYHRAEHRLMLRPVLKWAASQHRVYRELADDEMERVTQSTHHEGLAMVVPPMRCARFDAARIGAGKAWVALDGVENPHNLGAIVRTCAFFGVHGILVGGMPPDTRLSSALLRLAEGGGESVAFFGCPDLPKALGLLAQRGVPVAGLETGGNRSLGVDPLPYPCALVFGNEGVGLSPAARKICADLYTVRGAGHVESLNVSVTVGVAVAELMRGRRGAPA